jgi:phage/plasmid-like protein (TIGR03299 family)
MQVKKNPKIQNGTQDYQQYHNVDKRGHLLPQVDLSGLNATQICSKVGLDWEVAKVPMGYQFLGQEMESTKFALINAENGAFFDAVNKNWEPVQNEEVIGTFLKFCEEGNLSLDSVYSSWGGKAIYASAPLGGFVLPDGDEVQAKLLLSNHHVSGNALRVRILAIRQVCTNGMTVGVKISGLTLTHNKSLTSVKIRSALSGAIQTLNDYRTGATKLQQLATHDEQAKLFIMNHFGGDITKLWIDQPQVTQEVYELYKGKAIGSDKLGSYNTGWGLLQAVTEYYNHHGRSRGGADASLRSLLEGAKAAKQSRAMAQLVSLTGR